MSQDPNATNLTAAGYVRFGSEVIANQSEVILFNGDYQPCDPNQSFPQSIWTGSDLVIWGSLFESVAYRYNLASNRISIISGAGAPINCDSHTTVWTGTEMIVWGGRTNSQSDLYANTGGRYRVNTDTWVPTSISGAPTGRRSATAVWTGSEMIVWGGYHQTGSSLNTGGRYNPRANSWTPVSTVNAPAGRSLHAAFWTGTQMIVWGGDALATGGLYNPLTDS